MKIMITWLRKNRRGRTYTNGDVSESIAMSAIGIRTAVEQIQENRNCSYEEAVEYINDLFKSNFKSLDNSSGESM